MSSKENIETYTIEQKIEGYRLFSDIRYSYRIKDHENKLVSCCQVFGSCSKEPVFFRSDFSSNEIQFRMEPEAKLFSITYHLYCPVQNIFFAHIKSKMGETWQLFDSDDCELFNIVFPTDIEKRGVNSRNTDEIIDYVVIQDKNILGGITIDLQNEIKQKNNHKEYSNKIYNPTSCKFMFKLKPKELKLDPRTLWATTIVLHEPYKITPYPTFRLV